MPQRIRDNRLSPEEFWDHLAEWSQATFGSDQSRGPQGPLKHLANPEDVMEFVDCLFLVFDAARRAGFTYHELVYNANVKLKINRARKWGPPSATEPTEHVRGHDAQ